MRLIYNICFSDWGWWIGQNSKDNSINIFRLNVSHDAFFTVIITLVVFSSGLLFQKLFERNKKQSRYSDIEKSIISHIKLLNKFVTNQSETLKKYSVKLKSKMIDEYDLGLETEIHTKHIEQFEPEDLFNIFIVSKKHSDGEELYANIWNDIEWIKNIKDFIKNDFYEMKNSLGRYEGDWYDGIKRISQFFDKAVTEADKTDEETFLFKFWKYYSPWVRTDLSRDLEFNTNDFITPVIKLCREHIEDKRALELIHILRDCENAITNYINLCELRSKSFGDYADKLKSKYSQIVKNISELCNVKMI